MGGPRGVSSQGEPPSSFSRTPPAATSVEKQRLLEGYTFRAQVLLVAPHLDYTGSARLLSLLAAGLPAENIHVCVLGDPTPWCEDLRAAGVGVDYLGWRWDLDLRPLLDLHTVIAEKRPDIIHAWGFGAAWPLVLTGCRRPGRLFLSAALPSRRLSFHEAGLLQRAGKVVAFGGAEGEAYQRLGVLAQRVVVVPPSTAPPGVPVAAASLPELPEGARVVLAVGPLAMHKGQREAVWAFDILRCLYDDLHLVIVGGGPDEERIQRFTQIIRLTHCVHFTGPVHDLQPWFARAEVVWAPSLRPGGRQTVLEAMAAGRPVVASRLPGLAEVVVDGQTGFLVTPGDKAELARQTRLLLDHADLRRSMGEAARQHVAAHFSPAGMVEALATVYE